MTGWLIALGILVCIAILPVGISLMYHEDGLILSALLGLVRIKLFPRSSPKTEKEKPIKPAKSNSRKTKPTKVVKEKKPKENKGGKITDFLPLLDIGLNFLGSFRRKLRVKRLELNLIMAGGDPSNLAVNYGKAWAAVGNLMPLLEQVFVIKKRNVQVQCDFVSDATRIHARLDITITIGRLIGLVVKYGVKALCALLKILKSRENNKGGANL